MHGGMHATGSNDVLDLDVRLNQAEIAQSSRRRWAVLGSNQRPLACRARPPRFGQGGRECPPTLSARSSSAQLASVQTRSPRSGFQNVSKTACLSRAATHLAGSKGLVCRTFFDGAYRDRTVTSGLQTARRPAIEPVSRGAVRRRSTPSAPECLRRELPGRRGVCMCPA
jgi:hypothetical protein